MRLLLLVQLALVLSTASSSGAIGTASTCGAASASRTTTLLMLPVLLASTRSTTGATFASCVASTGRATRTTVAIDATSAGSTSVGQVPGQKLAVHKNRSEDDAVALQEVGALPEICRRR